MSITLDEVLDDAEFDGVDSGSAGVKTDLDFIGEEEWFSLDDIVESDEKEVLYCIGVDSPDKQFLIGKNISVPTHNTDEGKEDDAKKGEAQMIIGSIARLGRAAGVHLVIATQRPDAKLIPGETKANLGVRINCGRTDSNASSMILGTGEGVRVRANPRGRLYLRIYGSGDHGQGFFADPSWIDEYLDSKGLNLDGTPKGGKQSRLAKLADMSQFSEGDLDSRSGIDNSSIIDKIREEEEQGNFSSKDQYSSNDSPDDDWGFEDDSDTGYSSVPDSDNKMGRPTLDAASKRDDSKFKRAEDDWDADLDDLIAENNS